MYRQWPSYMHTSTHLFFTLKNAWVVCSVAPAMVFKINKVLTFSCKLLSQQQKPNILSLFGTVLPKGINWVAGTQGQIQGVDSHRLITFTVAPFFFFLIFFSKISSCPRLQLLFLKGGRGEIILFLFFCIHFCFIQSPLFSFYFSVCLSC